MNQRRAGLPVRQVSGEERRLLLVNFYFISKREAILW